MDSFFFNSSLVWHPKNEQEDLSRRFLIKRFSESQMSKSSHSRKNLVNLIKKFFIVITFP